MVLSIVLYQYKSIHYSLLVLVQVRAPEKLRQRQVMTFFRHSVGKKNRLAIFLRLYLTNRVHEGLKELSLTN